MTLKWFMGLGPYNASVGDHVYILFGVDVPFVLRRMESKGNFRIIGDCYTHGFMDGEILEAERRGEVEMESINIH
ncbi:hypothetical protein HYALB_00013577 [Hymenoscyphus albidus]|uniref:Uncharacterized protein n=1 Tax=Hymenoscyphus albidus TaxID=595503 RepID=A0A9N9QA08_9HELO|nr:hypothetical protein HYALB_00013577 [Hymenoscyphus albidus]